MQSALTSRFGLRLFSVAQPRLFAQRAASFTSLATKSNVAFNMAVRGAKAPLATHFAGQRYFSSGLAESLEKEIDEEMENKMASIDEILEGSGFSLAVIQDCSTVLSNGNTYLSFDANELETEEGRTTLPLTIRVAKGPDMLVIDATATENEEDDRDEGLMEEFGFEITGMTVLRNDVSQLLDDPTSVGSDDEYSPFYDDLDPGLQDSVMKFLVESGLRPDTAKLVFEVAEVVEHKVYVNWLETLHRFAKA